MKTPAFALALSAMILTGCADSRLNPFNWFGSNRSEARSAVSPARQDALDRANLVERIVDLRIERSPDGAIIRATGLPPTQGYWGAELEPVSGEQPVDGVITYRFRVNPPPGPEPAINRQSREVVVARAISDAALQGARSIRVMGATNALTKRR